MGNLSLRAGAFEQLSSSSTGIIIHICLPLNGRSSIPEFTLPRFRTLKSCKLSDSGFGGSSSFRTQHVLKLRNDRPRKLSRLQQSAQQPAKDAGCEWTTRRPSTESNKKGKHLDEFCPTAEPLHPWLKKRCTSHRAPSPKMRPSAPCPVKGLPTSRGELTPPNTSVDFLSPAASELI